METEAEGDEVEEAEEVMAVVEDVEDVEEAEVLVGDSTLRITSRNMGIQHLRTIRRWDRMTDASRAIRADLEGAGTLDLVPAHTALELAIASLDSTKQPGLRQVLLIHNPHHPPAQQLQECLRSGLNRPIRITARHHLTFLRMLSHILGDLQHQQATDTHHLHSRIHLHQDIHQDIHQDTLDHLHLGSHTPHLLLDFHSRHRLQGPLMANILHLIHHHQCRRISIAHRHQLGTLLMDSMVIRDRPLTSMVQGNLLTADDGGTTKDRLFCSVHGVDAVSI